jgi:hypothetical protein
MVEIQVEMKSVHVEVVINLKNVVVKLFRLTPY